MSRVNNLLIDEDNKFVDLVDRDVITNKFKKYTEI
jgi:predicted ABC-class ATPase